MTSAVPQQVRDRLGPTPDLDGWLAGLPDPRIHPAELELPSADDAATLLTRLGAPDRDRDEVVAARPSTGPYPELGWLVAACRQELVDAMGVVPTAPPWPHLPDRLGAVGRYFYAWVFLAALPDVRRYHAARGIPDDASWEILGDLGRQLGISRRLRGVGGLWKQNWLRRHFQGAIYSLGRLQFERRRLGPEVPAGLPGSPGEGVLSVHIPESGPLTPQACTESVARAAEFFRTHFPEVPYRFATCTSWLLDDQLADYLPARSNIVAFQRRFRLLPGAHTADASVVEFVFRRVGEGEDFPARVLAELPRRTSLERAVVAHLRSGRHWHARGGWLEL